MNKLFNYYSDVDKELVREITSLYNNRNYYLAIQKIRMRLEDLSSCKTREEYYLKVELAGYLIDGKEVILKILFLQFK